jgi:hypothetical protein
MARFKSLLFLLALAQIPPASATVTYAVGTCKPNLKSFTPDTPVNQQSELAFCYFERGRLESLGAQFPELYPDEGNAEINWQEQALPLIDRRARGLR